MFAQNTYIVVVGANFANYGDYCWPFIILHINVNMWRAFQIFLIVVFVFNFVDNVVVGKERSNDHLFPIFLATMRPSFWPSTYYYELEHGVIVLKLFQPIGVQNKWSNIIGDWSMIDGSRFVMLRSNWQAH